MLRFSVHNSSIERLDQMMTNAHLIGPEDLPIRGKPEVRGTEIVCRRRGTQPAGLCVQHDAGPMGRLMLQTCLLPDRDEPYHLTLELARHRIKTFIAKIEEWQMFDLSHDHNAMRLWEEAREVFIRALTLDDRDEAEAAAQKSLVLAIKASERLAMTHADILLHRRFAHRAASSSTLGIQVWPKRQSKALQDIVARDFDVVVLPLPWRELEVEEGKYSWDPLDRWMNWAQESGKPIVAGPLLDFSRRAVPEWLYVWQHDYDTCRDLAYDHVERVVQRYRDRVSIWNLGCGLNVNDNFTFSYEQMLDLTRMASLLVRQNRRNARTIIEVSHPFSEHVGTCDESIPPTVFIDRVCQEGIKIDAVGVQIQLGTASGGRTARDLMQISSMLDRFAYLDVPVLISSLAAPSEQVDDHAGWWQKPWSDDLQTSWLTKLFAITMSKPFVESIFWSELYDHEKSVIPRIGLITDSGQPKPILQRLIGVRRRLRKPLGTRMTPTESGPVAS